MNTELLGLLQQAIYTDAPEYAARVHRIHQLVLQESLAHCQQVASPPVPLSKDEWEEIYYALLDKANEIALGKYGKTNAGGVSDAKWIRDLKRIANKIGPDGRVALARGVRVA